MSFLDQIKQAQQDGLAIRAAKELSQKLKEQADLESCYQLAKEKILEAIRVNPDQSDFVIKNTSDHFKSTEVCSYVLEQLLKDNISASGELWSGNASYYVITLTLDTNCCD